MSRVKTEVELDSDLMALVDKRAEATGRPRSEVIEDAVRQQFDDRDLAEWLNDVRLRKDLDGDAAMNLAYEELDAMRAERREKSK